MALTNKCIGMRWWAFGGLEELADVRLQVWRELAEEEEEEEAEAEAESGAKAKIADLKLLEAKEKEQKGKGGNGDVTTGEDPSLLATVVEGDNVEFEIF